MKQYQEVLPKKEKSSLLWILVVLIPTLVILITIIFFVIPSNPILYFEKGTNPEEVQIYTAGQITITKRLPTTPEDFYDTLKKTNNKETPNSTYSINAPQLEYQYNFYDKKKTYFDSCKQKKVNINFSNPKYSEFTFNYQDTKFNYNINLYRDLYQFTDTLKEQACYFTSQKYTEAFLSDPYNNNFMESVAQDFAELRDKGYTDNQILEIATLFAQSITYGTDKTESNRYAYETFFEEEGNCLDKSVILIEILKKLDFTTYIILGQSTQYHALVGVVCDKGNIQHENQEICFIETTIFTPISSNVEIEIEKLIKTSSGTNIYFESYYGKNVVNQFTISKQEAKGIENEINEFRPQSEKIQKEMCKTDCVICDGDIVDFEKSGQRIKSCQDANEYNEIVSEYNDIVGTYNDQIQDWYTIYYELEQSMFENVQLVKRN